MPEVDFSQKWPTLGRSKVSIQDNTSTLNQQRCCKVVLTSPLTRCVETARLGFPGVTTVAMEEILTFQGCRDGMTTGSNPP